MHCPRCGAEMHKAIAWSGNESEFWLECDNAPKCNTYYNTFKPLPHQKAILEDTHSVVAQFGGFGSAKSYATRQFIYKQAMLAPKGLVIVGANIKRQYKETIQKELEEDIPKAFVKSYSAMDQTMTLQNGCKILWTPYDDAGKLRSMNASAAVIIEASEVNPEVFSQLRSRLRNTSAGGNGRYFGQILIESNPDAGWIKTEVVDVAGTVTEHGSAHCKTIQDNIKDESISVHVSATDANPYLPADYITNLSRNKPSWWTERYLYGSFEFSDSLVYPSACSHIVPSFDVPDSWPRLVAHDPGISDTSAFVNVALDPNEGIAYVYKVRGFKSTSVKHLVEQWKNDITKEFLPTSWYTRPLMDPKFYGKRQYNDDLSTYDQMWAQYNIYFQPGHIQVLDRVWRMNTYLESGKLRIMDNCEELIAELKKYKWVQPKLNATAYHERPVDKDNHFINCVEWICCALPEDPNRLAYEAYTNTGKLLGTEDVRKQEMLMWMFKDHSEESPEWSMY